MNQLSRQVKAGPEPIVGMRSQQESLEQAGVPDPELPRKGARARPNGLDELVQTRAPIEAGLKQSHLDHLAQHVRNLPQRSEDWPDQSSNHGIG